MPNRKRDVLKRECDRFNNNLDMAKEHLYTMAGVYLDSMKEHDGVDYTTQLTMITQFEEILDSLKEGMDQYRKQLV